MKKHDVSVVVRCCDPTYSIEALAQEGIKVVVSEGEVVVSPWAMSVHVCVCV